MDKFKRRYTREKVNKIEGEVILFREERDFNIGDDDDAKAYFKELYGQDPNSSVKIKYCNCDKRIALVSNLSPRIGDLLGNPHKDPGGGNSGSGDINIYGGLNRLAVNGAVNFIKNLIVDKNCNVNIEQNDRQGIGIAVLDTRVNIEKINLWLCNKYPNDAKISNISVKNIDNCSNNVGFEERDHGTAVVINFLDQYLRCKEKATPKINIDVYNVVSWNSEKKEHYITQFDVLCAMYKIMELGYEYVNMSLGFNDGVPLIARAMNKYIKEKKNAKFICAAGNDYDDLSTVGYNFPSGYSRLTETINGNRILGSGKNIIEVVGLMDKGNLWKSSGNFGSNFLSTLPEGFTVFAADAHVNSNNPNVDEAGTSFATPRVLAQLICDNENFEENEIELGGGLGKMKVRMVKNE